MVGFKVGSESWSDECNGYFKYTTTYQEYESEVGKMINEQLQITQKHESFVFSFDFIVTNNDNWTRHDVDIENSIAITNYK